MRLVITPAFRYVIIIVLMSTTRSTFAGPPFVTDDPEPVDSQHWEINYAYTQSRSGGDTSAGVPIDINYGATSDMQLHVQPRYSYEKSSGETHSGIDNTEIGIKYRFWQREDADSSMMIAVYPLIELPTGRSEFGPDRSKTQTFLPLWVQYANSDWTIYGGAGYRINPVNDGRNSVFTGGAALYRLTPKIQVGGELFNETSTGIGEKSQTGFNLGTIYALGADFNFLFSAGRGLRDISDTNQFTFYCGLQVNY